MISHDQQDRLENKNGRLSRLMILGNKNNVGAQIRQTRKVSLRPTASLPQCGPMKTEKKLESTPERMQDEGLKMQAWKQEETRTMTADEI